MPTQMATYPVRVMLAVCLTTYDRLVLTFFGCAAFLWKRDIFACISLLLDVSTLHDFTVMLLQPPCVGHRLIQTVLV